MWRTPKRCPPLLAQSPSGEGLLAQIEGDRNAGPATPMGKYRVRQVARKEDHQTCLGSDENARRNERRQEGMRASLARIEQVNRRSMLGIVWRLAGIDIVGAGPSGTGVRVRSVEIARAVDVCPGMQCPTHRPRGLPIFRQHPARRLIGHFVHMKDEAASGVTAEFELARLGVPAADIRLAFSGGSLFLGENPLAQLLIELRTI